MLEHPVATIALIVLAGTACQYIAWRTRIPSILLLLGAGLILGPATGLLDPDSLLGVQGDGVEGPDLLFPFVSLAVALILFEGGLELSPDQLRAGGRVVRLLVSLGVVITAVVGMLVARVVLDVDWEIAALLAAVLVVSGPTVIGPLLDNLRLSGRAAPILRAEGILIDPIGALLAVIVFEIIVAGTSDVPWTVTKAVVGGIGIGFLAGLIAARLLRRFVLPDFLVVTFTLAVGIGSFALADEIQEESGLLAVTVAGMVIAAHDRVPVVRILEFNETVRVVVIGALFVLIGARLDPAALADYWAPALVILAALVLIARPLGTWLCTIGSGLSFRERVIVAAVAPRGIVAASVASVFALRLEAALEEGTIAIDGADAVLPVTFVVIIGTILVYGLGAPPIARRLGLSVANPQGVLLIGAHAWARELGAVLEERGVLVRFIDSDWGNVRAARWSGLKATFGNALSPQTIADVDLSRIGYAIVCTADDQVNSLAAAEIGRRLGRASVFQLAPRTQGAPERMRPATHLIARVVGRPPATFDAIDEQRRHGARVGATPLTPEFGFDAYLAEYEEFVAPLIAIGEKGAVRVLSDDGEAPKAGVTVVGIVRDPDRAPQANDLSEAEASTER